MESLWQHNLSVQWPGDKFIQTVYPPEWANGRVATTNPGWEPASNMGFDWVSSADRLYGFAGQRQFGCTSLRRCNPVRLSHLCVRPIALVCVHVCLCACACSRDINVGSSYAQAHLASGSLWLCWISHLRFAQVYEAKAHVYIYCLWNETIQDSCLFVCLYSSWPHLWHTSGAINNAWI